jgi:dipeptidyl aminopeptidase/acylaminoacyl peptidase
MRSIACVVALFISCPSAVPAQEYQLPPQAVVDLLDAPPSPSVRLSPDARWMLIVEQPALPSIADVARPWIGLAGLRIDPSRNSLRQTSFGTGLVLRDLTGDVQRRIALPAAARIDAIGWSHTSDRFALTVVEDDRIELWVCETAKTPPRRLVQRLNTVLTGFRWMPDGRRLLVSLIPEDRGAAPSRPAVPSGPIAMESSGRKSPLRTYQDLLSDEHDTELFEHYTSGQLTIVDACSGDATALGQTRRITSFEPSPDGQHVLVSTLQRPFSYVLPYYRFPELIEVWTSSGELQHTVAALPLADTVPIEGVPTGPRGVGWRPGEPATLIWVEALDDGDPKKEVPHRDRWMACPAPFADPPRELLRTEHRARGLTWFHDPSRVLAAEYDRDRRWLRALLYDLNQPGQAGLVLEDRSIHDRYGHPGSVLTQVQPDGTRVAWQAGDWIFRAGEGDSPEGAGRSSTVKA